MSQANAQAITILPVLATVPAGMQAHPIVDASNEPFIGDGDWVVLDPNVTALEDGALYMFREPVRDHLWHVSVTPGAQNRSGKPIVTLSVLNPAMWDHPAYRSGIATVEWALDHCMGKVVGLHQQSEYDIAEGFAARIKALQDERDRLLPEEQRLRELARAEKWSEVSGWEYTEREADNVSGQIAQIELRMVALQNAAAAQKTLNHILSFANVA